MLISTLLWLPALGGAHAPAPFEGDIAIQASVVHVGDGTTLENAVVLIRDGRIAAVGADVSVPEDVVRIEHDGHLSAGLIARDQTRLRSRQFVVRSSAVASGFYHWSSQIQPKQFRCAHWSCAWSAAAVGCAKGLV